MITLPDDRQLPVSRRQTIFQNGTLIVQNVARQEDEGEYKCLIRDSGGETAKRSTFIRVLGEFISSVLHSSTVFVELRFRDLC